MASNKETQQAMDSFNNTRRTTLSMEHTAPKQESKEEKQARIKHLLDNPIEFMYYYFGHYMDSKFAWFHKEFIEAVTSQKDIFAIAEFPREHAKSVVATIFIPLYLKAKGELTGMVIVSSTAKFAIKLLSAIQKELSKEHSRYIQDFGHQVGSNTWAEDNFVTKDGVGFWAFGKGQTPRGIREAANRPNYAVGDDLDDKKRVKNPQLVQHDVQWFMEDLYGTLSLKGARLIVAGNRIHGQGILAHLVGDITPDTPKNPNVYHVKAYAIEDPQTKEKSSFELGGKPAWHERYTRETLQARFDKVAAVSPSSVRREFFHEHIEEGVIFKNEWIKWGAIFPLSEYDAIATYCDPSFKDTKNADFKAIVTAGKKGKYYHVLFAWVRQTSIRAMVNHFYDLYDTLGDHSSYHMEANMLQDLLEKDFEQEADLRQMALPLKLDKSKKADKFTRIENLTPSFERGLWTFNELLREDPDMKRLVNQLLGFGGGGKDDGPDALQGAVEQVNRKSKRSKFPPRTGKYKRKTR